MYLEFKLISRQTVVAESSCFIEKSSEMLFLWCWKCDSVRGTEIL